MPDKLAAYQLPITAVRDAVARQNVDVARRQRHRRDRASSVLRTMGRIADPAEFNDLVVATVNGAPIRVRDVGRAEDGTKEQRSLARLNGVPTVIARGPPAVRGQHRRGHRGGQGSSSSASRRSCRRT